MAAAAAASLPLTRPRSRSRTLNTKAQERAPQELTKGEHKTQRAQAKKEGFDRSHSPLKSTTNRGAPKKKKEANCFLFKIFGRGEILYFYYQRQCVWNGIEESNKKERDEQGSVSEERKGFNKKKIKTEDDCQKRSV